MVAHRRAGAAGALVAMAALGTTGACGRRAERAAPTLTLVQAYAPEPVSSGAGAVYLRIVNPSPLPDTLVGVHSPIAEAAEVHAQRITEGMVHMHAAGPVPVPANGAVLLEPGGLHIMLTTLRSRPRAGDSIDVTLRFARAGARTVRVPVIRYADVDTRAARARERP